MLKIFKSPVAFSFGLEDRFNAKMEECLNKNGIRCMVKDLWSDFWARHLFFSHFSYGPDVYFNLVAPLYCRMHLSAINADDVVWINGSSLPVTDEGCWFERQVIRRGASYIFWLEDDYFSDLKLKTTAEARIRLAHLVVTVTPVLRDKISQMFPDIPVIALEEPIDTERLKPKELPKNQIKPLVFWCGRPWNLNKLLMLNDILQKVYHDIQFTLRIITGVQKPEIALPIPWHWVPYDPMREAEYAVGAVAALAPLEDTPYNACKGNYKVKTYMALGVPPLASPVGYNIHLIKHGETGFLPNSEAEWESALRTLLQDGSFAANVGAAARLDIMKRYSYKALMPIWADALRKALPNKLSSETPAA